MTALESKLGDARASELSLKSLRRVLVTVHEAAAVVPASVTVKIGGVTCRYRGGFAGCPSTSTQRGTFGAPDILDMTSRTSKPCSSYRVIGPSDTSDSFNNIKDSGTD
jgi:hypothetical protein